MRAAFLSLLTLFGHHTFAQSASLTATDSPLATSTGFPTTDGLDFSIDGTTTYYAGTNTYWLAFLNNNSDVDHVLDDLASSDLKILRIWGFNDVNTIPASGTVWFQLHANGTSTINTGTDGLQKLDYVVSSAESRGVKLIINFVNNWDDYGGMNAYVVAYGGNQTSWYTNSQIQTAYQTYIKAVVNRYSSSSAIFAWELANEPRCNGCDTSVITDWVNATSAYIKSLDSNHMVTIGDGKFRPGIV
jgi:mannan endo-1,4-beta-mannosidase